MAALEAIDPASGEVLRRYDAHTKSEVDQRLTKMARAQAEWRTTPLAERVRPLLAAAEILTTRSSEWAALMAVEMGKPITQGRAEAEKCAWVLRHYAEKTKTLLAPEPANIDGARAFVRFDPLGPLLAIMPWNYPFWQLFRCAAPALAAGNAMVLKHASNVPGCALAIERIFAEAGLPAGLFTTLLIHNDEVAKVIADERIAAVTLTGSERAGAEVASHAGRHLKKTVLELGGSDAFIILANSDIEKAIDTAVKARVQNTGQSCIAAKRFIVEHAVAPQVVEGLKQRFAKLKMGSPLDANTELGPMARGDLRDGLHDQVQRSIADGARLIIGGVPRPGPGYYYPGTLLVDCGPGVAAWDEETFGPVAAVMAVSDAEKAIEAANASPYGLGASLWTHDLTLAERLAARIESGSVFVNGMVKSDPRVPFGGVKRSGYGRELGRFGIHEWTNIKTVWIEPSTAPSSGSTPRSSTTRSGSSLA